ncbi:hypothetical protein TNCV_2567241 [Trichonephila clavipes]|uniref:Uncharacterized protein n=1 Tax=Trichonephila clavipes TaxID=2585209 RepID=A0A8X6WLM9_TRICX|nr:hypothetical protein TNCV_2567241 [Trichonephila clavipes]
MSQARSCSSNNCPSSPEVEQEKEGQGRTPFFEREREAFYTLRYLSSFLAVTQKTTPLAVRTPFVMELSSSVEWGQYGFVRFHPNFEVEHPKGWSGPPTNFTRGLVVRRLFRVPPCHEGPIHLQTSMPSPGFEPSLYGVVVSVTSYYTGWAADKKNKLDRLIKIKNAKFLIISLI